MCVGAATSVIIGGIIRGVTGGDILDARAIATDALLGAAGVGIINKFNQVARLAQFADTVPIGKILTASGDTEQITQGVYYLAQDGASYIGQGGLRAGGVSYAERIGESAVKRFGTDTVADDAIRFSVSNGSLKASREVAEQNLIDAIGGIENGSLLNALNPIGASRQGLLATPGYGEITGAAVPNLLGKGGAGAFGAATGAAANK
jgi:hypothetical protein